MMGERSAQDKLFGADHIYLDYVGRDTLYGYLAQQRRQLFRAPRAWPVATRQLT